MSQSRLPPRSAETQCGGLAQEAGQPSKAPLRTAPRRSALLADRSQSANAQALAKLLEHWAAAVPMWDPDAGEPWYVFADRRYSLEKSLERRLRALPTCSLWMDDSTGTHVELTLAGIRVRSDACIAGACRAWAAEIRRQLEPQVEDKHLQVKQAVGDDESDPTLTKQGTCYEP